MQIVDLWVLFPRQVIESGGGTPGAGFSVGLDQFAEFFLNPARQVLPTFRPLLATTHVIPRWCGAP